jgi:aerobic carbon-monoxide dehydrogenase medium subunit
VIPAPVEYVRASTLEEAFEALAEPDSKALAGGQSLVSVMKLRVVRPSRLVDIGRLDLGGLETHDGDLRLGALVTWSELTRAPAVQRPALAAISDCSGGIGDLQVRNRGTLGGSLAHADPASDMPAVVLAFGAQVHLRSPDGERKLDAAELQVGPFTTSLEQRELITRVVIPLPPTGSGSAYVSVEHPASGFALAGAAALVHSDGTSAVGLTGVADRPLLLSPGHDTADALSEIEIFGDSFAPAEYRRHLAAVVVERALERARVRAQEDR